MLAQVDHPVSLCKEGRGEDVTFREKKVMGRAADRWQAPARARANSVFPQPGIPCRRIPLPRRGGCLEREGEGLTAARTLPFPLADLSCHDYAPTRQALGSRYLRPLGRHIPHRRAMPTPQQARPWRVGVGRASRGGEGERRRPGRGERHGLEDVRVSQGKQHHLLQLAHRIRKPANGLPALTIDTGGGGRGGDRQGGGPPRRHPSRFRHVVAADIFAIRDVGAMCKGSE